MEVPSSSPSLKKEQKQNRWRRCVNIYETAINVSIIKKEQGRGKQCSVECRGGEEVWSGRDGRGFEVCGGQAGWRWCQGAGYWGAEWQWMWCVEVLCRILSVCLSLK